MSNISERITALSPEQKKLLELRLQQKKNKPETIAPILPRKESDTLPLSLMQERLWFGHQLQPEIPVYNESSLLKITGNLNINALEKSINTIIQRHEILRTSFQVSEDKSLQIITPETTISLPVINLQNYSKVEKENKAEEIISKYSREKFDLETPQLLRITLISLDQQEHLMLITMHHIISDGWSWNIFYQELGTLYQAFSNNEASPLAELPIQYGDFSLWHRKFIEQVRSPQLNYWRQQLKNAPPILELPTDYPRPATQSFKGKRATFIIPQQLTKSLKDLSKKEGVTNFVLLLAVFKTLLYRYSQQTDILVGVPVSNRDRTEIENLIGCLINTLVLKTTFDRELSFSELLQQLKSTSIEAFKHQDLPFEELVKELQVNRLTAASPLFQVMFVFQEMPLLSLQLPDLSITPLPVDNGIAKFDLTLYIEDTKEEFIGFLEYSSDLFSDQTIKRMLAHLQALLKSIVTHPQQKLSKLFFLTEPERQQLLVEWNDTEVDYPQNNCIHELFEARVEKTPDAVAVIFEDEQLTYAQLNAKANQLAHYLRSVEVKPEVRVGICVKRSVEMVIGLLAILKAGGAYVPLDPNYPQERLAYMLSDSQPGVLLTQQYLLESIPEHQAQVVCLDTDWEQISKNSTKNPESKITLDNLAYVIYTSGSTGKPKGVMNAHSGILNRLLWMQDTYLLTSDDAILQKTPFSFDVSVWEFFWTLMTGARLVVAQPGGHKDPNYLVNLIRQHKITTLHFVPSMLQIFLEAEGLEYCQSIKRVICSGEALSLSLQEKFFNRLNCELHNLYGPTEAAIDVTHWQCQPDSNSIAVPIGRPIANTQIYILDRDLQPVPIGVAGELYIGGVGLAIGYLNQPELTREKFISNPFNPGTRLYKTGDLARWRHNGTLEYLGRIDYQVKLRGFRIELGEIETVIARHPFISDCVVVPHSDRTGDKRLVAYYIALQQINGKQLRESIEPKLPEYMIPSAWVQLETLPLTPNGKCDRACLPIPDFEISTNEYIAPRNSIEENVAEIWQEVLNLGRVSIKDSFFELGGHSLLATQVVSKIRQSLAVELPLSYLFEHPTVAELADWIENSASTEVLPIEAVAREGDLPLSFAQQRLWFVAQLEPDSFAYNGSSILELAGELDRDALVDSINEIVRRHEMLRTSFVTVDGQPKQKIATELRINLDPIDLSPLSAEEQQAEVKRLTEADKKQVFELTKSPLFRLTLLRQSANQHLLLITMHHIISDAWSTGIFVRELSALYTAFINNRSHLLPELAIQYADFAVWQRHLLQGEFLESQLTYWQRQLSQLPKLNLPTVRPRTEVTTNPSAKETFVIPVDLAQKINSLSRQAGVSLFMTMLAVLQVLLQRYTSQDDIIVGTDVANRNRSEIEPLIGFFVNLLVLRTDLSSNPSFSELLQRTRQVALEAYAHQDLPFDRLVNALQPQRYLSHTPPLFQVLLVLQNAPLPTFELPGLNLNMLEVEESSTRFDLALFLTETEAGIEGKWQYNADLFAKTTIAHLSTHFQNLLYSVTQNPDTRLNNLQMLSDAEIAAQDQTRKQKRASKLAKFKAIKT